MRLRERLAGLSAPATGLPAAGMGDALEDDRGDRLARLRALISEVTVRTAAAVTHPSAPRRLPLGETRQTATGEMHVVERWLEPEHAHGRIAVRGAASVDPVLLARLAVDRALEDVDPSRMLILDTETTGLSGGTGTVPFLIGLAFFDQGVLKVEQLFLRELGAEAPLLHHLAERLAAASCIVSYNGKAFDWPLLRTRFVMNRVALPVAPPHLDLLHCARRIWKARLDSLRLTVVERELLGHYREDDIDGAEIPGLYLRYLRGADADDLLPVLAHNQDDLVALAAVLLRLCVHFERVQPNDHPSDHLAYAKLALRGRDFERARAFAEAAACDEQLGTPALLLAAAAARLTGEFEAARGCYERALALAPDEPTRASVDLALARFHERKLKDLVAAYRHARGTLLAEGPEAHGRRLGRLRRRLERELGAS
jgi:uncharacterized protein YprB with RNaseH-like and TPR domain